MGEGDGGVMECSGDDEVVVEGEVDTVVILTLTTLL
jgi:hypothetical protein